MTFAAAAARMDAMAVTAFGVEAARTPAAGGAASTLRGIFDAPWQAPQFGALRTGVQEPRFTVRTDDAQGAAAGDTLVIGAVSYAVVSVEPDSTGITVLVLR